MINLYTKFEVSAFGHYEYVKENAKCITRNWLVCGGYGLPNIIRKITI